jgi:hypothetical protein
MLPPRNDGRRGERIKKNERERARSFTGKKIKKKKGEG